MSELKNLEKKKFGKLTAIKYVKNRKWICKCSCGKLKEINSSSLLRGLTKSCGCLRKKISAKNSTSHGLSKHKLYNVWNTMKSRCSNKKHNRYHRYGGRGIIVCKKWKENFVEFYKWAISNGWKEGLQIDRKNNDGNYCPSNCRFVTNIENYRNSSSYKKTAG